MVAATKWLVVAEIKTAREGERECNEIKSVERKTYIRCIIVAQGVARPIYGR